MMQPATIMWLGSIVTSVLACLAFIIALTIAYMSADQANLGVLVGIVGGGFNTVIGFWLGSSAGSQRKDQILATKSPDRRDAIPGNI